MATHGLEPSPPPRAPCVYVAGVLACAGPPSAHFLGAGWTKPPVCPPYLKASWALSSLGALRAIHGTPALFLPPRAFLVTLVDRKLKSTSEKSQILTLVARAAFVAQQQSAALALARGAVDPAPCVQLLRFAGSHALGSLGACDTPCDQDGPIDARGEAGSGGPGRARAGREQHPPVQNEYESNDGVTARRGLFLQAGPFVDSIWTLFA
jgi:hypothetical protein